MVVTSCLRSRRSTNANKAEQWDASSDIPFGRADMNARGRKKYQGREAQIQNTSSQVYESGWPRQRQQAMSNKVRDPNRRLQIAAYACIVAWGVREASHLLSLVMISLLLPYAVLPLHVHARMPVYQSHLQEIFFQLTTFLNSHCFQTAALGTVGLSDSHRVISFVEVAIPEVIGVVSDRVIIAVLSIPFPLEVTDSENGHRKRARLQTALLRRRRSSVHRGIR